MPRHDLHEMSEEYRRQKDNSIIDTIKLCLRNDCKRSKELYDEITSTTLPMIQITLSDFRDTLLQLVIEGELEVIADDLYGNVEGENLADYTYAFTQDILREIPGFAKFLIYDDKLEEYILFYFTTVDENEPGYYHLHSLNPLQVTLTIQEWMQKVNRGKGRQVCGLCVRDRGLTGFKFLCTRCNNGLRKIPGTNDDVTRAVIAHHRRTQKIPLTKVDLELFSNKINLTYDDLPF